MPPIEETQKEQYITIEGGQEKYVNKNVGGKVRKREKRQKKIEKTSKNAKRRRGI